MLNYFQGFQEIHCFNPLVADDRIRPFTFSDLLILITLAITGEPAFEELNGFLPLAKAGIKSDSSYTLLFANTPNTFILRGDDCAYLLLVSSYSNQFNSLALALFSAESRCIYLSLPVLARKLHPSHPTYLHSILSLFSDAIHKSLQADFRDQPDSFPLVKNCILYFSPAPHLGHYVLNGLGPSIAASDFFRRIQSHEINSNIILATRTNGYIDDSLEKDILRFPGLHLQLGEDMGIQKYAQGLPAALFNVAASIVPDSIPLSVRKILNPIKPFDEALTVIGVGVRGGTRQALNLPDLVERLSRTLISRGLSPHIIVDGLASSVNNSETTTAKLDITEEQRIGDYLASRLREIGCTATSVIGMSLLDQLNLLQHCKAYIGHMGSSSAKSLWLLGIKTITHGPHELIEKWFVPSTKKTLHALPVGLVFQNAHRNLAESSQSLEVFVPGDCISEVLGGEEKQRPNYLLNVERTAAFIADKITCC